jgi:hypothetical protein
MSDVIHDPETDWCACEPNGANRCDYRMLADTVIEKLNPRDGDEAEVALCIAAVERIAAYVKSVPCICELSRDGEPCGRCAALGQWHGETGA